MNATTYFNQEDAKNYGTDCAVLLNHFRFWIDKNKENGKNFYEGKYWTYQTLDSIASKFSHMTKNTVRYCINKLERCGALVKGNFNKTKYDRTTWYALPEEKTLQKSEEKSMESSQDKIQHKLHNQTIHDTKNIEKNIENHVSSGMCDFSHIEVGKVTHGSVKSHTPIPDIKTDDKKDTTARAAVSSSSKENNHTAQPLADTHSIPKKPKIYACLESVDIPIHDKEEISRNFNYTEEIVKNAIEWATAPDNPPTKCLAASIKYACKYGIKLEVKKPKLSVFQEMKLYFKNGEFYNEAECFLDDTGIAFMRTMKHGNINFDKFFSWNKFSDLCNDFGIKFSRTHA